MIPLSIFLLACVAVYLGAIEAAFSALMRLSLRLVAERSGRPDALGEYLDDPLLLFMPVRLLLGLVTAGATALLARAIGIGGADTLTSVIVSVVAFVVRLRAAAAARDCRPRSRADARAPAAVLRAGGPGARSRHEVDRPDRRELEAAGDRRAGRRSRAKKPTRPRRRTSTPASRRGSSRARSGSFSRASSISATPWSAR